MQKHLKSIAPVEAARVFTHDSDDAEGLLERIHWLLRVLARPELDPVHETALRDVGRSCSLLLEENRQLRDKLRPSPGSERVNAPSWDGAMLIGPVRRKAYSSPMAALPHTLDTRVLSVRVPCTL